MAYDTSFIPVPRSPPPGTADSSGRRLNHAQDVVILPFRVEATLRLSIRRTVADLLMRNNRERPHAAWPSETALALVMTATTDVIRKLRHFAYIRHSSSLTRSVPQRVEVFDPQRTAGDAWRSPSRSSGVLSEANTCAARRIAPVASSRSRWLPTTAVPGRGCSASARAPFSGDQC